VISECGGGEDNYFGGRMIKKKNRDGKTGKKNITMKIM